MTLVAAVQGKAPGGDGSEGVWIRGRRIYLSAYQPVVSDFCSSDVTTISLGS